MVASNQVGNTKRGIGIFSDPDVAEKAINELKASGFPMENVSVIAKQANPDADAGGAEVTDHIGNQAVNSPMRAAKEAFGHSAWASVLVGLTALALPGVGPVLATGGIAAALVASVAGMGAGAVASVNLVKALTEMGIPQLEAEAFSNHLLNGDALVVLEGSNDQINQASTLLKKQGIEDWNVYGSVQA